MTLRRRATVDVAHLPDHAFGPRDLMAWGTFGFIVIEGFTLILCAFVYLYLTKNFGTWPPEGTLLPDRGVPTVQVALMVLSIPLMHWLSKKAHDHDLDRVRLGLTAAAAVAMLSVGLRIWDITMSLNVRWDANAYGSAQWLVVGTHSTLMAIQLYEVMGMAAIFWLGPVEKNHFSDAADIAIYLYFIVLSWIPLYVLCFLLPYWI